MTPRGGEWIRLILTAIYHLGPTRVGPQTASRSIQPFSAQLTRVFNTQRHTDHATCDGATSIAIGRIYVLRACDAV